MVWNILALFYLLSLQLCSDSEVESIPNEIHITFIYHSGRGNEYEVDRNQRTPLTCETSPLDKTLISLLLNQIVLCFFFCFFFARCLISISTEMPSSIWFDVYRLTNVSRHTAAASSDWKSHSGYLSAASVWKSFVYETLCCISPHSFLFRLLKCPVLACILPACFPFLYCLAHNVLCNPYAPGMECLNVFWEDFIPPSVDGFFRPVQTWTLGGWVVCSRAMSHGSATDEGGGRFRVRETGSHRDSTRSL